jgi:hypothetical protein
MRENILHYIHVAVYVLWIILLVPWLPLASAVAMAFDEGPSFTAYLAVTCVWTYPAMVFVAWKFRHKSPLIPFLPFLNIAPFIVSFLWKTY